MRKEYTELLVERTVEKIEFWDIHVQDLHAMDEYSVMDSTRKLNLQQVWEWLNRGGDWNFFVTPHDKPDKVFIRGTNYDSMRDATDGKSLAVVGFANDEQFAAVKKLTNPPLLTDEEWASIIPKR